MLNHVDCRIRWLVEACVRGSWVRLGEVRAANLGAAIWLAASRWRRDYAALRCSLAE